MKKGKIGLAREGTFDVAGGVEHRVIKTALKSLDGRVRGKLLRVIDYLNRLPCAVVEYSGGCDSTLLLYLCHLIMGENVRAFILDSPTLPKADRKRALRMAKEMGVGLEVVKESELENEEFVKNPNDRCYYCRIVRDGAFIRALHKSELRGMERGECVILDGANYSDLGDYRPGLKAADKGGVRHPFIECEITKEDIRAISRALGLETWDLPSNACLASRIRWGLPITEGLLKAIDMGEEAIRYMGFRVVRVRVDAPGHARVEVGLDEIGRAFEMREEIIRVLNKAGFRTVSLDLEGYRPSGLVMLDIKGRNKSVVVRR